MLFRSQLSDFACALGLQLNVCEKNSYNQPVALYNNPEFEVCLPTRWFNHEDMYGYLQRWYAQVRGTLIEPLPYYLLDRHVEYLVRLSLSVLRSDAEGFPAVARWLMWLGSQSVHKIRALISAEARHILEFDGFKVTSSSVNRAWLVTLMHLDLTPDGLDYLRSLLPDEESALVRLLIEG